MYKQRCMMVLKKRKMYDNQLKQYMNQQFTLDQVAFTSESIQNTLEMVISSITAGQDDERGSRNSKVGHEGHGC